MPPELRVFAVTNVAIDGRTHHPVGRLPMAEDQQIDPAQLALPLPGELDEEAIADPAQLLAKEQKRWWASWETAKAVGLGGEWLLPVGMTPQNIDALYVVGIGDETPEAHFKAQVDAGEMGVLRLGAPTNTVRGAAAADLGQNAHRLAQGGPGAPRAAAGPATAAANGRAGAACNSTSRAQRSLPSFPAPTGRRNRGEPPHGAGPVAGAVGSLAGRSVADGR